MQLEVVVTTTANKVLLGVIFDDGSLGIYDAIEDRYYRREWHLFKGWRPLPTDWIPNDGQTARMR